MGEHVPVSGEEKFKRQEAENAYIEASMASVRSMGAFRTRVRLNAEPLLTAEEEVGLAQTIEVGLFASHALSLHQGDAHNEVSKKFQDSQEPELYETELQTLIDEGKEAFERYIRANQRLVFYFIRTATWWADASTENIIAEANLGLKRAVEKFDYTKGVKFSTYASYWIKVFINEAIRDSKQGAVLNKEAVLRIEKVQQAEEKLTDQLQRFPTDEELAESMGKKVKEISFLRILASGAYASMPDYSNSLASRDRLSDPETALDGVVRSQLGELVYNILASSPYATKDKTYLEDGFEVITRYYGLHDGHPLQPNEIMQILNLPYSVVNRYICRTQKLLREATEHHAAFRELLTQA